MKCVDLDTIAQVYLVGIKGVGMTSLACMLKDMGKDVIGSDIDEEFATDPILREKEIDILVGFTKENINHINNPQKALVIYTGAHNGASNEEVVYAQSLSIPTCSHAKALGLVMSTKNIRISVAGSHGKTTTTAMIAHILSKTKKHPSFAIGAGSVTTLAAPGYYDTSGSIFVAEADEYVTDPKADSTPRFMHHNPTHAILTSIDYDHPDVFSSEEKLVSAFNDFLKTLSPEGLLVVHKKAKNKLNTLNLPKNCIVYGRGGDFQIISKSSKNGETKAVISSDNASVDITLSVPGVHNLENALAAGIVCNQLGVSWDQIAKSISTFRGSKRRFERVGIRHGMVIIDDYAHHPEEIKKTIEAARSWYKNARIAVLFQPHTYSRTKVLKSEFVESLSNADVVCVAPIFASAREDKDTSVSSQILADELSKIHNNAHFVNTPDEAIAFLHQKIHSGDILLTLGAGDIYAWHGQILTKL